MREPPIPVSGNDLLPWAKRLVDYLRESRVEVGPGLRLRRTSSGSIVTADTSTAGVEVKTPPLYLTKTRPAYIPQPSAAEDGNAQRIYLTWGGINNTVAKNWKEPLELSSDVLIYADITLNQSSSSSLISEWEYAAAADIPENPEWPDSGPGAPLRPAKHYLLLGYY